MDNEVTPLNEEAYRIAERIFELRERIDAREVFLSAIGVEEVLRLARKRAEFEAMLHVPDVLNSLKHLATVEKDVRAARMLLEVAGVLGSRPAGGGSQTAVVNQINISPQEIVELERELYDK